MYWINIKSLKDDLRSGNCKERSVIPYIIAEGILIQLLAIFGTEITLFDFFSFIICVIIIIFGTWYVFEKHNQNSATSFLVKYITLGWVLNIRLSLIMLPIFIPLAIIINNRIMYHAILSVSGIIILIVYYRLLGKHIAET